MKRSTWNPKRVGITLTLALLIGIALYFGGRWQERNRAAAQRAPLEQSLRETGAQLARSRRQLAAAEHRMRLLRAQNDVYEAAVELDRRNFGLANAYLRDAARVLATVNPEVAGVNRQEFESLRRTAAGTDVSVATNLASQRRQVLQLAGGLGRLLPEPAPVGRP